MKAKAVLLDLDDTLLCNHMERFVPRYMQMLSQAFGALISPERLLEKIMEGMAAMDAGDGKGPCNEEVFRQVFFRAAGQKEAALDAVFKRFYAQDFPQLRAITRPLPEARPLLERLSASGRQVVVATNPVFPRTAVEQRLEWAGIPVKEFPYTLLTTIENMHATKASPDYYREILSLLNLPPRECLMAGDDWERDVKPASAAGIPVYWVTGCGRARETVLSSSDRGPDPDLWRGEGSLGDLLEIL